MKNIVFLIGILLIQLNITAQPRIISGPMLGPVEYRDAKVWVEVSPEVKKVSLQYKRKNDSQVKTIFYKGELGNEFNPLTIVVGGLDLNTTYQYNLFINDKPTDKKGEFTTKDLWQWRKDAPDFSFLTGSCAFFNQPEYDKPGVPYGKDSSIFESMAKERSNFMLWLGDAWYSREVDFYSEWGLWYRASHDRAMPVLQNFLKAMPHYAIWDDHDFGPNDAGKYYPFKEVSKKIFNSYFCNPSAGENGQGIYTMTSWSDADFFMLDCRWWRSADDMEAYIDGKPNPEKKMLGAQQMEWLKNSLLFSNATFKIIANGIQVLNPLSPINKWQNFPDEYNELMNFIKKNKIEGVIFLTGDRHHSEIIKEERSGTYTLYDITVSPLTSKTHVFSALEKNNPGRILGIDDKQNYGKISIAGKKGDRKLTVEYFGLKGDKLGEWSIHENSLKTP